MINDRGNNSMGKAAQAAHGRGSSPMGAVAVMSLVLGATLGLAAAFILLPEQSSHVATAIMSTNPKAYWYLSRASAFVALGLLWLSMALGLLITDKMARSWPGAPVAFAVHEFVSLLGLGFAAFHALILLGDHYINYRLSQILMPFGSVNYHPVWVGLGQIGLYAWALISATFYVRQWIGSKTWKLIHYLSFFNFIVAILHGIASGTDTALPSAQAAYWFMGGTILFLTVVRVVAGFMPASGTRNEPQSRSPHAQVPTPGER
jgi:predicted ferric reductase